MKTIILFFISIFLSGCFYYQEKTETKEDIAVKIEKDRIITKLKEAYFNFNNEIDDNITNFQKMEFYYDYPFYNLSKMELKQILLALQASNVFGIIDAGVNGKLTNEDMNDMNKLRIHYEISDIEVSEINNLEATINYNLSKDLFGKKEKIKVNMNVQKIGYLWKFDGYKFLFGMSKDKLEKKADEKNAQQEKEKLLTNQKQKEESQLYTIAKNDFAETISKQIDTNSYHINQKYYLGDINADGNTDVVVIYNFTPKEGWDIAEEGIMLVLNFKPHVKNFEERYAIRKSNDVPIGGINFVKFDDNGFIIEQLTYPENKTDRAASIKTRFHVQIKNNHFLVEQN